MLRRTLPLWMALLCTAVVFAQEPQTKEKPDHSQEPFVIEKLHTYAQFQDDGTGRRRLSARIRVQNEAGVQALGQLILGYNSANETMSVDAVRVLKADGTVVTAGPEAVQDLSAPVEREAPVYTDYRQKHITVPGLRPGETLEYDITTQINTPLAAGHFWFDYIFAKDVIVLDERVEVTFPASRTAQVKTQLPEGAAAAKEEVKGGRRILLWTHSQTVRDDEDEDTDTPKKKKENSRKPQPPDIQLSTFASWEQVGRWYAALESERIAPSDAIRSKASEITAGLNTDLEKVQGLYGYVARNFRYVSLSFGVGRFQPHAAADVLANQYGDCKDKHTLLAALLEAAGLHAWPVLIHSQRKVDEALPSPSQFDHLISVVPLGEELLWMDTTTEVAPFRMLSANLRGKKALVIPRDGSAPRLMETPPDPPFPSTQDVKITGSISELGRLEAHVQYTLRGDNELPLRMAFRRTPQNRWKQIAQIVAYSDGLSGEILEVKPSDPADTAEPFRLEYRVSLPNFFDWSSKKSQLRVPLPGIGMPGVDEDAEPDDEPLELGSPADIHTSLELTLPAHYSARAPVPVGLTRDYAEYRSRYKVEASKLTAERTMRFLLREIPSARARDYAAFSRAVRSDMGQSFSVESTVAGAPVIPESAKADELFQSGVASLQSGNYRAAIALLKRVVEKDPKYKNGWNTLGQAHLLLREFDEAVAAFRRQIEESPYDENAHNNLGQALWQQRKLEEAATAFQKQIEISPLDRFAHANLGNLLRELRRYEEAADSLERAVVITPDNALLYASLGQCYLNLQQPEKAIESFDKAVELSPSPVVFNNVAYELSLHNTHLDRAQQYAESAVATAAAALRNTALDRLTLRDISNVSSLAAYWDTLGWVYFQRGELATAERYVAASWLLDLHGEVGDHLAQVYEKTGRRDQAVAQFALALAATRPAPETRERLLHLVQDEKKVAAMTELAQKELTRMRTVPLGALVKETASAEFFVLLAPGTGADGSAASVVEEVKFISGDEKLRPFAEALRSAPIAALFPDETPTKLVRRGTLSCGKDTGCSFVLITPDSVTSLN